MQSQVKFNRVPKKVPEKVGSFGAEASSSTWYRARPDSKGFRTREGSGEGSGKSSGKGSGRLWCRAMSGSTGFRRRFWRRPGRLWCRARSGSTGFRRRFQRLASQHASERFVKIKRCGCWGYHRSLFLFMVVGTVQLCTISRVEWASRLWGWTDHGGPWALSRFRALVCVCIIFHELVPHGSPISCVLPCYVRFGSFACRGRFGSRLVGCVRRFCPPPFLWSLFGQSLARRPSVFSFPLPFQGLPALG